ELLRGRWLEPLGARRFHVIVSNPPYIGGDEPELQSPALRYEPRLALSPDAALSSGNDTAGSNGSGDDSQRTDAFASLREIIATAPPHLDRQGWLLLEHGSTQASQVAQLLVNAGFRHVRSHRDLAGHERITEGQWP